jgi:hypothetical protein
MSGSLDWSRLRALVPTVAWLAVPFLATGVLHAFDPLLPSRAGVAWLLPAGAGIAAVACGIASIAAVERSLRRSAAWLIPALAYAVLAGGLAGAAIGSSAVAAAVASAATVLLVGAIAGAVRGDLPPVPPARAGGELSVRASVGLAVMLRGDALDPDLLLARADAGLAIARQRGGDAVALDPALRLQRTERPEAQAQRPPTTQDSGG